MLMPFLNNFILGSEGFGFLLFLISIPCFAIVFAAHQGIGEDSPAELAPVVCLPLMLLIAAGSFSGGKEKKN